ncbi:MAG: DNA gyrase C-terminal beta-propeller domain-containing protein, partial [Bacteroidota bacterium]
FDEYRMTNRGGKGVRTLQVNEKTGKLVAIKAVLSDDQLMIINKSGIIIRMKIADVREQGRATQGVKVIRIDKQDAISDVAVVRLEDDEEE